METDDSPRRRARTLAVVLLLMMLAAASWWGLRSIEDDTVTAGADTWAGEAGYTWFAHADRSRVPDVEGATLEGRPLRLRDFRDKVVVLNVWGSWCAPCRAEAPELAAVARETRDQQVQFLGIDVRDNPAAGRAFARRFAIHYPSFDDQSGAILAEFAGIVPVSAVPSTIVVDRAGGIAARIVGRVRAATLRGAIADLLVERATPSDGTSG